MQSEKINYSNEVSQLKYENDKLKQEIETINRKRDFLLKELNELHISEETATMQQKNLQNTILGLIKENDDLRLNLQKATIDANYLSEKNKAALDRNKELAKENQLLRDKGTRFSDGTLQLPNIARSEQGKVSKQGGVSKKSCLPFLNR